MAVGIKFLNHSECINNMFRECVDLRDCYDDCTRSHIVCKYEVKNIFFNIRTPYLMDSQARAISNTSNKQPKRKRKKNNLINLNSVYHKEMCDQITKCDHQWKIHCLQGKPTREEILINNIFTRKAAEIIDGKFKLSEFNPKDKQDESLIYKITNNRHITSNINFKNKLILHEEEFACILQWDSKDFIIPANSSFLLSNDLIILTKTKMKYDCILIDPPWNNKSLKRKHCYTTSSEDKFLDLPIPDLANENCLICVWTTNSDYLINYVKLKLFPHWNVTYITDWHWLKVTQYGELVVPLTNHGKKPYENLILGRIIINSEYEIQKNIPNDLIFVSVPSCFHSHKPLIKDLLKDFIPDKAKYLEIFSRSLCPDWTSFGDEVLKFQQIELYDKKQ